MSQEKRETRIKETRDVLEKNKHLFMQDEPQHTSSPNLQTMDKNGTQDCIFAQRISVPDFSYETVVKDDQEYYRPSSKPQTYTSNPLTGYQINRMKTLL